MTDEFRVIIDTTEPEKRTLQFQAGTLTFILGANGTGKSSLMGKISKSIPKGSTRLDAHRDVTLESSSVGITGQQRQTTIGQFEYTLTEPATRYSNSFSKAFNKAYIYDLKEANHTFESDQLKSLKSTNAGSNEARAELIKAQSELSPLKRVEKVLIAGGLNFLLSIENGILKVKRPDYGPYGIQELSDGERAAYLLAAAVVTAPQKQLILIDEPERHLHRAISSPLIDALLDERPDCTFVISTHDISLPLDQPTCSAILLRDYKHSPQVWNLDFIEKVESIDARIAKDVLGARKQILFVEGNRESLDLQLYSKLFPNITIRAQDSCSNVIQSTKGVNASSYDHWVEAYGLVDQDRMSSEAITKFQLDNIFALNIHSVESLYYHPQTTALIITHLKEAGTIEADSDVQEDIKTLTLHQMGLAKDHLIRDAVVRAVREQILSSLPVVSDFTTGPFDAVGMNQEEVTSIFDGQKAQFERMVTTEDVVGLISTYKVKSTSIPTLIAKALKYSDMASYENTVRAIVGKHLTAADKLRSLIGPLSEELGYSQVETEN